MNLKEVWAPSGDKKNKQVKKRSRKDSESARRKHRIKGVGSESKKRQFAAWTRGNSQNTKDGSEQTERKRESSQPNLLEGGGEQKKKGSRVENTS